MKNTETLKLIDGQFVNDDASEILMNLFTTKINFYSVKNLSSYVRFGCDDGTAQERITNLNLEIEKLQSLLDAAKATNKKIVINSQVNIALVDAE